MLLAPHASPGQWVSGQTIFPRTSHVVQQTKGKSRFFNDLNIILYIFFI